MNAHSLRRFGHLGFPEALAKRLTHSALSKGLWSWLGNCKVHSSLWCPSSHLPVCLQHHSPPFPRSALGYRALLLQAILSRCPCKSQFPVSFFRFWDHIIHTSIGKPRCWFCSATKHSCVIHIMNLDGSSVKRWSWINVLLGSEYASMHPSILLSIHSRTLIEFFRSTTPWGCRGGYSMVPTHSKLTFEQQFEVLSGGKWCEQTCSLEKVTDSLLWGPMRVNFLRAEQEQQIEARGSLISSRDDKVNFLIIKGAPYWHYKVVMSCQQTHPRRR